MKKNGTARRGIRRYHFIGVGGMGMGHLALLMLAKGYEVSGSDVKESGLTRQLRERGARISIGHHVRNLEGAQCVVYSSAISASNPEMFEAVRLHIPILRRAELLAELVNREVGITIAGAHGKTTTSSMASLLLIKAGLKPTTAIGGIVGKGYNASLGIGRHFVAEVDESDGSFLYFKPHFSIITNIDMEHLDHYQTWDRIKEAYLKFAQCTVPDGVLLVCGDDETLRDIALRSGRRFVTYGFGEGNDWVARDIQCDAQGSSYVCFHKGQFVGRFVLSVPGKHNALNSLAVVALAHELKIGPEFARETLEEFQGVARRFQRKGEVDGVMVVDDYAHHPTEIMATLQTAKTIDRTRLVVVFQPHRYTRTKALMDQFAESFVLADQMILTDIYPASEKPIEGITSEALLKKIKMQHAPQTIYLKKEEIVGHLLKTLRKGDLLLVLGAGDITRISDDVVASLKERQARQELLALVKGAGERSKDRGVIGVLMGGCSSEREVSLRSGQAVVDALVSAGCQVRPIDLTSVDPRDVKARLVGEKIDMAFIALHGRFGEDGGIQTVLDDLGIPYNGCGPGASRAAFNKVLSQRIFEEAGVLVPRTVVVRSHSFDVGRTVELLGGYPLVVKPACEGSSIGVVLAGDEPALKEGVAQALTFGGDVLIQEH
ncbi:MAG: UDP-N-acetylmuramate--L-alanine ligase, partial [Elusimicrobia bacterium]|nr:UDP-N-acetylmuramate--L-alanine ligase [Elusimicrobiota bacterium]